MLEFIWKHLRPRIVTLRSRMIRLIEPRIHHYRFYSRAEKQVRSDRQAPGMPFDMSIDRYYMGTFLAAESVHFEGESIELVGGNGDMFLTAPLAENFLPEVARSSLSRIRRVRIDELARLPAHSCTTIIASHVLNEVTDPSEILRQMHRVLASDGNIVATVSSIAPSINGEKSLFGFSPVAVEYLFEQVFPAARVSIMGRGNVLAGRMLLSGQGTGTLTKSILDFVDPYFPIVTCVKVSAPRV